ncbi:hypothetical protein JTE90_016524 [Oedothorax gibbosus]|uniref:Secreted protein n=1 Tax=Oedothorax gibbosus TaxID=931172 RepID=A0AAV6TKI1_9ARAC|nr:hypothetical protein JTE90_016524 [Oedothorax gibbosus]
MIPHRISRATRLPLRSFTVLLTLLFKVLCTFPHGIVAIVSRNNLALGGVYHPIKVALPATAPRRSHPIEPSSYWPRTHFGNSPVRYLLQSPSSGTLTPKPTFPHALASGNSAWASPVHSPFTRKSLLVLFLPYLMLNSSGYLV